MTNNKKLYTVDKEGNLDFSMRNRLHSAKYKPDSAWNHAWLLGLIIVFCMIADYAAFDSLFSAFLYDSALLRSICVIGMVIILEFSPSYLGYNLKRRACGYRVEKIAIVIPLVAFVMGAAINIVLRLATHSLVFPDLSNAVTSIIGSGAAESEGAQNSLVYAWFFGLLPIITSFVAFAASYTMSNPLQSELKKLTKENIEITDQINQLDAVLAEYDSDENYLERVLADDDAKFHTALAMTRKQRDEYFDYVRQRISEHLGTAGAISYDVDYDIKQNDMEANY